MEAQEMAFDVLVETLNDFKYESDLWADANATARALADLDLLANLPHSDIPDSYFVHGASVWMKLPTGNYNVPYFGGLAFRLALLDRFRSMNGLDECSFEMFPTSHFSVRTKNGVTVLSATATTYKGRFHYSIILGPPSPTYTQHWESNKGDKRSVVEHYCDHAPTPRGDASPSD